MQLGKVTRVDAPLLLELLLIALILWGAYHG
jgi:hypothetical protein